MRVSLLPAVSGGPHCPPPPPPLPHHARWLPTAAAWLAVQLSALEPYKVGSRMCVDEWECMLTHPRRCTAGNTGPGCPSSFMAKTTSASPCSVCSSCTAVVDSATSYNPSRAHLQLLYADVRDLACCWWSARCVSDAVDGQRSCGHLRHSFVCIRSALQAPAGSRIQGSSISSMMSSHSSSSADAIWMRPGGTPSSAAYIWSNNVLNTNT